MYKCLLSIKNHSTNKTTKHYTTEPKVAWLESSPSVYANYQCHRQPSWRYR